MEQFEKPVYKSYRYCIVPKCKNTTFSTPNKVFFFVPRGEGVRKKWCKIINRRMMSPTSTFYCCEDHFDVEKDTENLVKYNILKREKQNVALKLKKGILPHKFNEKETATRPPPVKKEPIDEVFEIEPEADGSLYEETVVKIEIEPADKNCDALLHEGYNCNICLSSISGYRYSCVQCECVDLCAACEARGAHEAHYVLRIPRPRPGAEEEIAEILKELREILNKHTNQPAEQIICTPSNCFPAAEDPLQATPVLQDVRSLAHSESESDNESSSASSEEGPPGRYTPHPHHPNRARSTHEKVPPKRRKLNPYKDTNRSTVTYASTSITNPIILKKPRKSINSDTFDENSDTDEVSEAVNERVSVDRSKANLDRENEEADEELNIGHKLKKKPKAIEAASSPETVQQEEIQIKTEIDIPEDDVDSEIADDDNLREGEDEQQSIELGDRQLEIGKKRGRKQVFNTKRLQRTDEEPLDFIVVDKNLENDPLAAEETKKPRKKTESLKMAIGEDVRMSVRRIKRFK